MIINYYERKITFISERFSLATRLIKIRVNGNILMKL